MGLCAAIGLTSLTITTRALAAEKKMEKMEEKEETMKIPDTADGIWMGIHEHHMALAEVVKSRNLKDVHIHAFAIRDLANALPAKAAADKKARVEGTAKNIAKLAGELDESGDANDQAKTEANLKKLDGLLKMLKAQFPNQAQTPMDGMSGHDHK